MSGFTDKAKESTDKELMSIIEHSVATLVASGDITGTGDIKVTQTTTALVYTPDATVKDSAGTSLTVANALSLLSPLVGTDDLFKTSTGCTITISTGGDCSSALN